MESNPALHRPPGESERVPLLFVTGRADPVDDGDRAMKKKAKTKRESLSEKLSKAEEKGRVSGFAEGCQHTEFKYSPSYHLKPSIIDFIKMIESWPLDEERSIIQIAGTDLVHTVHAATPTRLFRAIANELKRLGYK